MDASKYLQSCDLQWRMWMFLHQIKASLCPWLVTSCSPRQPLIYFLFMVWPFLESHEDEILGTSLMGQWFRLCTSNAGGTGLIPGRIPMFPHAAWWSQKKLFLISEEKINLEQISSMWSSMFGSSFGRMFRGPSVIAHVSNLVHPVAE